VRVENVHTRLLAVPAEATGALLESLGAPADRLWPHEQWPALRLDGPVGVGAAGGHGPVRYFVEEHEPLERVRFRFTAPSGFDGWHQFRVESRGAEASVLTHEIVMRVRGLAAVSWLLVFRPLHDALIEDAFSRVEHHLTGRSHPRRWSPAVRILRRLLRTRRQ
jgi:hypothetical protein